MLQRRGGDGFFQYMHRCWRSIRTRRWRGLSRGACWIDLRNTATKQHGLTFAPDPETHDHCTLGGMLGNNSCGVHSLMARNNGMGLRVSDNTQDMEILTYEGHRFRVGPTSEQSWISIIRAGGPQGEIYAQAARRSATNMPMPSAAAIRIWSGGCQRVQPQRSAPGKRLQYRPRPGRFGKHAGHHSGSDRPPRARAQRRGRC